MASDGLKDMKATARPVISRNLIPTSKAIMASQALSRSELLSKSFSVPLSQEDFTTIGDADDDWEYEYSSTETETYYLTVDFTSPLIPTRRSKRVQVGRGGYKSKWVNPGLGRPERVPDQPPVISLPNTNPTSSSTLPTVGDDEGSKGDEGTEVETEVESEDQNNADVDLGEESDQIPEVKDRPNNIQILDLHSENPLVSYKGQAFSCNWAENIGTELLFTAHDPENVLPILRSLPDNVDLLAAVSARLNSTHVRLSPKQKERRYPTFWDSDSDCELYYGPEADRLEPVIPIGREASMLRKEQAEFLEKMMDLKLRKGEGDNVTIIAAKRLTNNAWHGQLKHKRDKERGELEQTISRGGLEATEAKKRLDELSKEEAEQVKSRKRMLTEREREGPSKRARRDVIRRPRGGWHKYRERQSFAEGNKTTQGLPGEAHPTLSTPTPQSWDDLDHGYE